MINLAIFASGTGSNFKNLTQYFQSHPRIRVEMLVTNNIQSPAIQIAEENMKTVISCKNKDLENKEFIQKNLIKKGITHIILAGYLQKIPTNLLHAYPNKIINIHPSLLPKHGGPGMYGKYVHQAVSKARDSETGITIHLVNEEYDKGEILAQYKCSILPGEDPFDIGLKIKDLETKCFPEFIDKYLTQKNAKEDSISPHISI